MNWKPSDTWTMQAGLVNGWDAFDRVSDNLGVVGKIRWDSSHSDAWTSFAFVTGDEFNDPSGQLADPALYAAPSSDELQDLIRRKAAADRDYAEAEEAWLDAAETLEQAQTAP